MITQEKLCACLGDAAAAYPCAFERLGVYAEGAAEKGDALIELLGAEGYTLCGEREAANNRFLLYQKDSEIVHVDISKSMNTVRVIVSPNEELFEGYDAIENETVEMTVMNMDYESQSAKNNGYGFIIKLADGGFLIYDGGWPTETDGLWEYLRSHSPEGKKPRVEGWILTHSHGDHYLCFLDYMKRYADKTEIKRILYSPARTECFTGGSDRTLYDKVPALAKEQGIELVIPYAGQLLQFPGVTLEVLLTADDWFPEKVPHDNNVSLVTRLTFPTKGGATVLMPADMMGRGCNRLVDQYGAYLKSDILQVPHHGCSGTTQEIILAADPEQVIYTTSQRFFQEWTTHSSRGWNNYLMYSRNVKRAFVADGGYQTIL